MRFFPLVIAAALAVLVALAPTTRAEVYGDVTHSVGDGKLGLEGAYTNWRRDVAVDGGGTRDLDYTELSAVVARGVGESGQIQGRVGTVSVDTAGADEDGFALGVGYRRTFGADSELPKGAFAKLSLVDAGDIAFTQIDVGFGVSHAFDPQLRVYGGGLISQVNGDIKAARAKVDFSEDSEFGLFGGGVFNLDESLRIGFEIHAVFESGFALFLEFPL